MSEVSLDQFYTQPKVARECWSALRSILRKGQIGKILSEERGQSPFFLEPSAGDGVFYDLLPEGRRLGLDIAPRHPAIEARDFLEGVYTHYLLRERVLLLSAILRLASVASWHYNFSNGLLRWRTR